MPSHTTQPTATIDPATIRDELAVMTQRLDYLIEHRELIDTIEVSDAQQIMELFHRQASFGGIIAHLLSKQKAHRKHGKRLVNFIIVTFNVE